MKTQKGLLVVVLFLFLFVWQAAAFTIEDRVQCTANLNVRATPSTSGTLTTTEANGSRGIIIDGPQYANGYTWWRVQWDNDYTGWSVESFSLVTWYLLSVASSNPNSSVSISVSPNDFLDAGNGSTFFSRFYDSGTSVTLSAPTTASGNNFSKWTRNGVDYSANRTINFTVLGAYTMTAVYVGAPPVPRTLTVTSSNPNSGVGITGNQTDNNGNAGGVTTFSRIFNNNAVVSFNAPATTGGNTFQKWQKDGVDLTTSTTASVTMDANHTITAVFAAPLPTAQTLTATPITATTAQLNANINGNGLVGTVYFQFGTTTSYGNNTPAGDMGPTAGTGSFSATGLMPNTLYHYRVVASTSAGTTVGNDLTFTTLTTPASYTISTSVSPAGAGTASGGGPVTAGQSVMVVARRF